MVEGKGKGKRDNAANKIFATYYVGKYDRMDTCRTIRNLHDYIISEAAQYYKTCMIHVYSRLVDDSRRRLLAS